MEDIETSQQVNEKAVQAMAAFLEALGVDIKALGMEKTPQRVAEVFGHFFSGLRENPDDEWLHPITTQTNGIVSVRNIRFHSICEHHLLPFFGTVHIAYYPSNGKIAGFGHFVQAVDILARRPQLQERFTEQLCQSITKGLATEGVLVIVQATHMCMTLRNSLAADTDIITAAASGSLQAGTDAYREAWNMLMNRQEPMTQKG